MANEKERLEKRIETYKKEVRELHDEITALRQMLDIAAANLLLVLKDEKSPYKLSKEEIKTALGTYHLTAREDSGFYILEIQSA